VQDDEPTLPPHFGSVPADATDPNAFSEAPTWPPVGQRPYPPRRPDRSPLATWRTVDFVCFDPI